MLSRYGIFDAGSIVSSAFDRVVALQKAGHPIPSEDQNPIPDPGGKSGFESDEGGHEHDN